MANKCLRRFLRSGRLLFFAAAHPHHSQCSAGADRKQLLKLDHLPELYSITRSTSSRRSHHFACLPLQRNHCLPAAASCSSSSACLSPDEAEDYVIVHGVEDNPKKQLLRRSHSCSKLQGEFLQELPSRKPLLLHPQSQSHLSEGSHSQYRTSTLSNERTGAAGEADQQLMSSRSAALLSSGYTRSWSSSSLHNRRHTKKATRSFNGEFDLQKQGNSKGKRAPKGHVVVYVDGGKERHVVPISCLSHPYFQALLRRAESEFGFAQKGGLLIPCSLAELRQTLHRISIEHNKAT